MSAELLDRVDREFLGFASPTAPRIQAGGHPCQGLYWTPKGKRPKVAIDIIVRILTNVRHTGLDASRRQAFEPGAKQAGPLERGQHG